LSNKDQLAVSVLGVEALGAVSELGAAGAVTTGGDAESAGAALAGGTVLPPLKSVAYQPEPFSWNPAAVTCFLNDGLEQDGQTSSGASDIFCSTSLANPQDSHL
jgi:hypothetical protein